MIFVFKLLLAFAYMMKGALSTDTGRKNYYKNYIKYAYALIFVANIQITDIYSVNKDGTTSSYVYSNFEGHKKVIIKGNFNVSLLRSLISFLLVN